MEFQTIFTLIILLIVVSVVIIFLITNMEKINSPVEDIQSTTETSTSSATGQVNCFINPDDPACQ